MLTAPPSTSSKRSLATAVTLENQQLIHVPSSLVPPAPAILVLSVVGNKFTTFPAAFLRLPNLKTIKFGQNDLSEAPGVLGIFTSLELLDLSANRLATLH